MSFSVDTKNELSRLNVEKKCCMLAEIAGFIRFCGAIRLAGLGRFEVVMSTENLAILRHYKALIKEYFDLETKVNHTQGSGIKKASAYELRITSENGSEQVLREIGILMVREGSNFISDGIYDALIKTKCCRRAYLRGAFLGAGTISEPEKGYHFEILCNTEKLAVDMAKLLNAFSAINAKIVARSKRYGVYLKDAEQIADVLKIMGVSAQLFKLEDIRLLKQIKNQSNRMRNCDTANVEKTVSTAEKQIKAIKRLIKTGMFEKLDKKLVEIATVRMENPYVSLAELGNLVEPPLKKSGVNHRLKKLESIAETYEEEFYGSANTEKK
ncbi:MAG: DNA-binding protein WhiA [Eubacteriales bacterium]